MIRKLSFLLILTLLIQSISFAAISETKNEVVLLLGSNQAMINGQIVPIDVNDKVQPIIIENRSYLPVRFLAESLGASVGWDDTSKEVTITQANREIRLKIGHTQATVNGVNFEFENPPSIHNDRTFVQLSALVEALNMEVFFKDGVIIISDTISTPSDNYIAYLKDTLENTTLSNNDIYEVAKKSIVNITTENNGTASGFFVSPNLILTNYHVVDEAGLMTASTYDHKTFNIDGLYYYDMINDLALIKTTTRSFDYLQVNDQIKVEVGQKVLTLGSPLGYDFSLSEGVVSALRNNPFLSNTIIQTDAYVTFGSSGSPLINEHGKVIGVITSGIENEDINFAAMTKGLTSIINSSLSPVDLDKETSASYVEDYEINMFIRSVLSSVQNNDRQTFETYFHPSSIYLNSDLDNFTEMSPNLKDAFFPPDNAYVSKAGDTFIVLYAFKILKSPYTDYSFVFHLKKEDESYKIMGSLMMTTDELIAFFDGDSLDEEVITESAKVEIKKSDYDKDLSFKPYDSLFDPATNSIYMTNRDDKQLVKYNIITKETRVMSFDHYPERLTLANGKLYMTLPMIEHDSYIKQEDTFGYIGIIDHANMKVLNTIEVPVDPYDIAVKDHIMYITDGSSQYSDFVSVSEKTEMVLTSTRIRQQCTIELHPDGDRIVSQTTDTSPRDLSTYHIEDGSFLKSYDSIYHGDYRLDVGFKIRPDGQFIVDYSGHIFRSGYTRENDLQYYKSLDHGLSSLYFDSENQLMLAGVKDKNQLAVYDLKTFKLLDTYDTKGTILEVGINQSQVTTVEAFGEFYGYGTYDIKLQSETVSVPSNLEIYTKQELDFEPQDIQYDEKANVVYMTDSGGKRLVKYNVSTNTFDSLSFDYNVERMYIDSDKIYVTMPPKGHDSYWFDNQYGYYIVVDKASFKTLKVVKIDMDPYGIVAKDGKVYISGGSGQSTYLKIYEAMTGRLINSNPTGQQAVLRFNKDKNIIYSVRASSSPKDITAFHIPNDEFTLIYDSIYHGDYDMTADFIFSPDGKYSFHSSGDIFTTGKTRETDIIYHDSLDHAYNAITIDLSDNKIYTNVDDIGTIYVYDYTSLEGLGKIKAHHQVVFMTGIDNTLLLVEKEDGIYYLSKIYKHD